MWQRTLCTLALATAFVAPPALADEMQPGLWEMKNDIEAPGMPDMEQQMAKMRAAMENMPPELRAQMEAQMAQMGMTLGDDGTMQICITPEEAAKGPIQEGHSDGECTYRDVTREGKTMSGRLECREGESGTFEVTMHNPRHFESLTRMQTPQGPHQIHSDARWLAADCGDVQAGAR